MSHIADLLAKGRTMSFEFSPPKTDAAARALDDTVAELATLAPSFVSVTYGAGGSTREFTRDAVIRISADQPFPAMPHLTCVGHTREDLLGLLADYRAHGIENVLALAGDPPADGSDPGGDFAHALELVELAREVDGFSVGVAAHPELHPRSPDRASDRRHLAAKLAVADFGVTQFFFTVADYLRMVDELDALGCTKPVLPGIMPIVNVAGIRRMSAMNNTTIPAALEARLDELDGDAEALRHLGVEVATQLCVDLLEAGAPGLHLYTLNKPTSVTEILANLGQGFSWV